MHFRFVRFCWLSGFIFGASWLPLGTLFLAFWIQVGVLGRPLLPKSASWETFQPPSWPPGGAWGLQLGLLGGPCPSKLVSLAAWASNLASRVSFGPPSWPPRSDFGLQVRLLGQLWAFNLTSRGRFWPPIWLLGLAFRLFGLAIIILTMLLFCPS